jgi:hypothetical protein
MAVHGSSPLLSVLLLIVLLLVAVHR